MYMYSIIFYVLFLVTDFENVPFFKIFHFLEYVGHIVPELVEPAN